EAELGERRGVVAKRAVSGQHDVVILEGRPGAVAIGPGVVEYFELRGEARGFLLPVEDERTGHDDEGRAAALAGEQGEYLHGLAEAHVVREAAAEAELAQEAEPAQAFLLVTAEFADE